MNKTKTFEWPSEDPQDRLWFIFRKTMEEAQGRFALRLFGNLEIHNCAGYFNFWDPRSEAKGGFLLSLEELEDTYGLTLVLPGPILEKNPYLMLRWFSEKRAGK